MLNDKKKRLIWFFPLLFTIYVCSITLFTHSHIINNIIYVHSHPFKFVDPPTHQHSENELKLLDQLFNSSLTTDILPNIDLTGYINGNSIHYSNLYHQIHLISPATTLQLRAPPYIF